MFGLKRLNTSPAALTADKMGFLGIGLAERGQCCYSFYDIFFLTRINLSFRSSDGPPQSKFTQTAPHHTAEDQFNGGTGTEPYC